MHTSSAIIPAIIPQSLAHLGGLLARIPFAPAVQMDVIDGVFAPQVSWPYGTGEAAGAPENIRALITQEVEVDLMVTAPEVHLDHWLAAGATRLVVHLESTERMADIVTHRRVHGYMLGIASDDDTSVEDLFPYLEEGVFVQCMGIDAVGAQGEPFEPRVLENIRALRTRYPDLEISVDGSVNEETISALRDAGANRFVAGSAIFAADNPEAVYRKLLSLVS